MYIICYIKAHTQGIVANCATRTDGAKITDDNQLQFFGVTKNELIVLSMTDIVPVISNQVIEFLMDSQVQNEPLSQMSV